jgi:hypothetical protein
VLAPPNRRILWEAAFDDQAAGHRGVARAAWPSPLPADAAWLVERIASAEGNQARSRLGMLAFAQRVFGGAEAEDRSRRDAGRVARPSAGTAPSPSPSSASASGTLPSTPPPRITRSSSKTAGRGEHGKATLSMFQGALAIVARAVAVGSLDPAAASFLVGSLCGQGLADDRYHERLAVWIERGLVLKLRTRLGLSDAASAESVVLHGMAGPAETGRGARLEWEGLAYDIAPAAAEYRRLLGSAGRQRGSTLDEALAAPGPERESRLAGVLGDLAYAAALGSVESAPAASEDIGRRHLFVFDEPPPLGGPRPEWALPREVAGPGQRWHAEGALLGLDVGLARLALRRLETDVPPVPLLSAADRRAFAEGAVLVRGIALDEEGRDRIAEACGAGARASARRPPILWPSSAWSPISDARLAPRRPAHDRRLRSGAFVSAFTLAEELWLGGETDPPAAWGTSARWDDGCLCPRLIRPVPLDELAGRTADGRLAAHSPDLHLRVAELLAEMQLPPRLFPAILSLALQDLMDEAEPAYLDDALAVARYARGLTRTRMEDYVAALVGRGPLSPVAEP